MYDSLSRYTTFGIGGRAKRLIVADTRGKLIDSSPSAVVLGRGSNVLVSDDGYDGTVVVNRYSRIVRNGNTVTVGSGTRLNDLVGYLVENSLGGMEWAVGIPGSVGGAVKMNAGAFGGEIADRLVYADVLRNGVVTRLWRGDLGLGYRKSNIVGTDVVIDAAFELEPIDKHYAQARCNTFIGERKRLQPIGKSAGSVFKNPSGMSVGKLIDELGYKGYTVGGAVVSDKHANIIINSGGATARDVRSIITTLKSALNGIGVVAEEEIVYIGEFS